VSYPIHGFELLVISIRPQRGQKLYVSVEIFLGCIHDSEKLSVKRVLGDGVIGDRYAYFKKELKS